MLDLEPGEDPRKCRWDIWPLSGKEKKVKIKCGQGTICPYYEVFPIIQMLNETWLCLVTALRTIASTGVRGLFVLCGLCHSVGVFLNYSLCDEQKYKIHALATAPLP